MSGTQRRLCVGVLALQGAFSEHLQLLHQAFEQLGPEAWMSIEVRTPQQLARCDALIIPGGESTTIALVAESSGLLEPLRTFVKVERKPTWGTCAGLILLSEAANRIKKGGQELIGGIDVRVNRNHFGRQIESFATDLNLPFLRESPSDDGALRPFKGVFIRAPIVERVLPQREGTQVEEGERPETILAPSRESKPSGGLSRMGSNGGEVEILATLPGRTQMTGAVPRMEDPEAGDIVAVRQRNVFGTSFHPELTTDVRIHTWWLRSIQSGSDVFRPGLFCPGSCNIDCLIRLSPVTWAIFGACGDTHHLFWRELIAAADVTAL